MKAAGFVALTLLTAASFAPLVGVILASALADLFRCRLDEGSVHPCLVFGVDLGDALYSGFVLGWLMLVTGPGMLVSGGIWATVLAHGRRRRCPA